MPATFPSFLRPFSAPRMRRRISSDPSRSELLESRVLPSAVAVVSKGSLNITGTGEVDPSDLQIEAVTGGVKVTALNGTSISVGGSEVTEFTFTGVTSLNVRLGEGDDSVAVLGTLNLKNVNFDLGDGNNVLNVGAGMSITGKLAVKAGTGNDQITFDSTVAKSATFSTGLGNDEVTLRGTAFSSTVSINTGAGADVVLIDENLASLDSSFNNTLTITTGEDADSVTINNSTTKRVSINTGDDDDVVALANVTANGTLNVQTSAGDDSLTLDSVTETLNGTNIFNLGTGADAVVMASSSFVGAVNIDLGTGINNSLKIDDTSFNSYFNLIANGSADVIDIEGDLSLVGDTVFNKAAKLKVGADADVNISVLDLTGASFTDFNSTLSVTGINPSADLTVAVLNTTFFSAPTLVKTNLINL